MLKLRRADLLIENGLELDTWADVAVQGANNPNIVRGAPGRDRRVARHPGARGARGARGPLDG